MFKTEIMSFLEFVEIYKTRKNLKNTIEERKNSEEVADLNKNIE